MMNNMLGEQDLNPYGFHQWTMQRRLPTMMSPIVITKDFNPQYVIGSGGSNRIRSANIQVILNLLVKENKIEGITNLTPSYKRYKGFVVSLLIPAIIILGIMLIKN